jgi:biotin transport system substrate-specific component
MTVPHTTTAPAIRPLVHHRAIAVVLGALLVAIGAQVALPLPGNPVPITLQVPAVLIVGGLLGPRFGAASLVLYLAMGAAGLPVFAPVGVPGAARLIGPTGGYLLAYPLAAGLVGLIVVGGRSWARLALAVVVGLVTIHAGGVSHLMVLGGNASEALRLGSLPFLVNDLLKLAFAALIIQRFGPKTRALH